ncbi:MAG: hypothetical protein ACREQZ_10380 [Woeseiaceae bacterium]
MQEFNQVFTGLPLLTMRRKVPVIMTVQDPLPHSGSIDRIPRPDSGKGVRSVPLPGAHRRDAVGDGPVQEHWILDCIRRIRDLPGVSVSAVVMARGRHLPSIREGLHRVLHAIDTRLRCHGEEALVIRDLGELPHVPVLGVDVRYRSGRWWLNAEAWVVARRRRSRYTALLSSPP